MIAVGLFFAGNSWAAESKLTDYVTVDQDQTTFRTHDACLLTQAEHGAAYTRCVVDSKLGGTTGFDYNCGARVFTEMFGYWANHGYPNLMTDTNPDLPSGNVPDYSSQTLSLFNLAGVEYTTYGDFCQATCHNCYTSMSCYTDHNMTTRTYLTTEVNNYFTARGYSATVTAKGSLPTYNEIKTEILAGRPVPLLINSCNHWVTVIGFNDDGTQNLTALVGHESFSSGFRLHIFKYCFRCL